MARGYPDYFGMSTFPKFGSLKEHVDFSGLFADGVTKTVCNLELKGVVYGGFLKINPTVALEDVYVGFTIDEEDVDGIKLDYLLIAGIIKPKMWFCYLTRYDVVSKRIVASVSPDITFDLGYKIEVHNDTGNDIRVDTRIFYAQVTY